MCTILLQLSIKNLSDVGITSFKSSQSLCEKVLQWSCDDECKYNCMWHTTQIFMRQGLDVPQFFGKVRILYNLPLSQYRYQGQEYQMLVKTGKRCTTATT